MSAGDRQRAEVGPASAERAAPGPGAARPGPARSAPPAGSRGAPPLLPTHGPRPGRAPRRAEGAGPRPATSPQVPPALPSLFPSSLPPLRGRAPPGRPPRARAQGAAGPGRARFLCVSLSRRGRGSAEQAAAVPPRALALGRAAARNPPAAARSRPEAPAEARGGAAALPGGGRPRRRPGWALASRGRRPCLPARWSGCRRTSAGPPETRRRSGSMAVRTLPDPRPQPASPARRPGALPRQRRRGAGRGVGRGVRRPASPCLARPAARPGPPAAERGPHLPGEPGRPAAV